MLDVAQVGQNAGLSVLADRAGIDDDDVGFGGFVGQGIALFGQRCNQQRRIEFVHLAAEAF